MIKLRVMDIQKRFEKTSVSKTFQRIIRSFGLGQKKVLDLGCGFGEYLALFGPGSMGITTNPEEKSFGKEKGLSVILGNIEELEKIEIKGSFDIIWANNFFEHILSPHSFLSKLRNYSQRDTKLILGVPVIPFFSSVLFFVPKFRGALASNHISFFTKKTLLLTVERSGWKIIETRPFIVEFAPLDRLLGVFAPHLYVVACKNESFAYGKKKLQEWNGIQYYEPLLKSTGQL